MAAFPRLLLSLVLLCALSGSAGALRVGCSVAGKGTATPFRVRPLVLQEPLKKPEEEKEESAPPASPSGYSTVYDDETPPAPRKDPLSNSMRARLIKEQQGLGALLPEATPCSHFSPPHLNALQTSTYSLSLPPSLSTAGGDPNSKNPFLFVFAGVGVFVMLGALAVNM